MKFLKLNLWSNVSTVIMVAGLAAMLPVQANYSHSTFSQGLDENDQIIETVTRYFIAEHASQWNNKIHFYLVCIDSSSPDTSQMIGLIKPPLRDLRNALFEELNDLPLPLRILSECRIPEPGQVPRFGIFEIESSQRGILYVVGERFKWIDQDNVQVYAWYHFDGLAGGGWVCNVKRLGDQWSVVKIERRWIS